MTDCKEGSKNTLSEDECGQFKCPHCGGKVGFITSLRNASAVYAGWEEPIYEGYMVCKSCGKYTPIDVNG